MNGMSYTVDVMKTIKRSQYSKIPKRRHVSSAWPPNNRNYYHSELKNY
jgi:hypothetical protein